MSVTGITGVLFLGGLSMTATAESAECENDHT